MPGKDQEGQRGKQSDNEASLQDELDREASEGADSIGDVSSNRTLSGSSTWETLPDESSDTAKSSTPKNRTPRKQ
jgi:hypothetical protein